MCHVEALLLGEQLHLVLGCETLEYVECLVSVIAQSCQLVCVLLTDLGALQLYLCVDLLDLCVTLRIGCECFIGCLSGHAVDNGLLLSCHCL